MGFFLILSLIAVSVSLVWLGPRYWRFHRNVDHLRNQSIIQQVELDHLQIYKTVVQNSPDLFVVVDQSIQVVVANKTAHQYGWSSSRSFFDATISDTSKLHFEFELKHVLKEGFPTEGEIRLVTAEPESWKFFLYHIFPVKDEQEKIIGATITALDITAQREAEEELHRQREFVEGILNAIPDSIYVKDDHHRYIYGNKSFSDMVGKELADYVGLKDHELFPEKVSDSIKRHDVEVLRTNSPTEIEEEIFNHLGKKWTLLSKRLPFQFQHGHKVLISIMRDFSERKRLENELQISKARQEEASRLATLGETAGGIAHEINNPLNVLVGVAELIKAKIEMDGAIEKEKMIDYSDRLVKYSMRIAKIIKGLRSISRDASHDPFTEVSLNVVVDETLELCRQQFLNRGIEMSVKVEQDVVIEGRYAQLSQIVMNLVNNARDAVEGSPQPKIFVEIFKNNSQAILRIWDSGAGVPEELESKIMRPFFTTKPAGKGTGLGLSISKSIAIEHKGTLRLNRDVAASCFELSLPLLIPSGQQNSVA